jgi:hypothetical protein
MTVTFAEKLARIPGYQAGVPTGQAPEAIAAGGIAQLASNESPFGPHPKVVEAIRAAAGAMNRYPDPDATLLRRRIAERYETEPGQVAVGNGSCEILLAAAEALCEPGAEILYAWPSFSMYPHLAALTGAREVRVPLAAGEVHDLDAMAAEANAATQLAIVCNPTTDRDPRRLRGLLLRCRSATHGVLDEAYVEFQTHDDVDAPSTCFRPAQPGRPAHSASATAWLGCGSATPRFARFRGRLTRAPALERQRLPRRWAPRRSCTRTTSSAGSRARRRAPRVEEGWPVPGSVPQTSFS